MIDELVKKYIQKAKECGLKFLSWNIWDRRSARSLAQQTAMFGIQHEWLFVFGKEKKDLKKTIPTKKPGDRHTSGRREASGKMVYRQHTTDYFKQLSTIFSSEVASDNRTGHPAVFPVSLPTEYIKAMTDNGMIICDPFGGSGATLIACEKTNRKCYIMDNEPKYIDVTIERWEKFTDKKAIKL